MPELRGRLVANAPLADITWFRVGGPAQVLFTPADEADLAYFLARHAGRAARDASSGSAPTCWCATAACRASSSASAAASPRSTVEPGHRLRAGTAVPDVKVARAAADAGIAGLAFYRGIPGSIGGALRMNAGAHGRETKDVLVEARAVDRAGQRSTCCRSPTCGFTYRHCGVPADWIFTEALFQGTPGDPAAILQADGGGRRVPRGQPADQGAHRRLDLQEPAGLTAPGS